VLRAIRSAGRPVALETPPADQSAASSRPEHEPTIRPVRLRAIDGALSRTDPPNPA
jgi:hypothetical protein